MDKDFFEKIAEAKYKFRCMQCPSLEECINADKPLCPQVECVFYKEEITKLREQLEKKEKEISKLKNVYATKNFKNNNVEINGVEFNTEQMIIIEMIIDNYESIIKKLRNELGNNQEYSE